MMRNGIKRTKTIAPQTAPAVFSVRLKRDVEVRGSFGKLMIFGIVGLLIVGLWGAIVLHKIDWNMIIVNLIGVTGK